MSNETECTADRPEQRHAPDKMLIRQTVEAATIGTPYILNSPQVQAAPSRVNTPVPLPSIYQDERGEIHNFEIGNFRVNLLYTRAGVMRSGDLHKDTQHDFVFKGKVRVWILTKNNNVAATAVDGEPAGTVKTDYGPGQYIAIPPYTPHIFESLDDSVVAEWWDGPFFAWFYQPYRKLVQDSFAATQPGKFAQYQISFEKEGREAASKRGTISTTVATNMWITAATALFVGALVGFVAGRRQR